MGATTDSGKAEGAFGEQRPVAGNLGRFTTALRLDEFRYTNVIWWCETLRQAEQDRAQS